MTILLAGQHIRRLLQLAHRAYLLEEGRILLEGYGPAILESRELRRLLLGL